MPDGTPLRNVRVQNGYELDEIHDVQINSPRQSGQTLIYDNRKILNRDIAETLEGNFSGKVFKTRIRETVSLAEAPTQGVDIFRYAPKSTGAEDYLALCREIIKQ